MTLHQATIPLKRKAQGFDFERFVHIRGNEAGVHDQINGKKRLIDRLSGDYESHIMQRA